MAPASPALAALLLALQAGPVPFASLAELDEAMAAVERGGDPEPFWARVKAAGTMPLLFGETAVFLHRSKADGVEWRGDFTGWRSSTDAWGRRLGQSDVWSFRRTFVAGARLDYKIVEIAETWLVDPLNPVKQLGGYGPNSVVRLPGGAPIPRPALPAGAARGMLGPPEAVQSERLGYTLHVRVYQPSRAGPGKLPILYVTDGSDYWHEEMGGLAATLDALIATGRIPPLLAVFVDAWDPARRENRRERELIPAGADPSKPFAACPFCEFLVEELAPLVEKRSAVDPSRRGILGTSLGGLHAAFMGYRYPDRFPLLAIQSPWLPDAPWLVEGIGKAARQPRRVAIGAGTYEERFLAGARALRDAYLGKGVKVKHLEVPDGHSWGHWSVTVGPMLEFLYGER
jgi:enterochelin esterase family protein